MRGSSDNVVRLIARLYDAAQDPTLWPDTLAALADCIGGAQVMMGVHEVPGRPDTVIAPRMSAEDLANYRDQWSRGDILWQRTNRAPVGQVLHAERYVPRDEFVRTPIYREWHRQLGIGATGIGVNLCHAGSVPMLCGIKRGLHDDAFSPDEEARFAALVPHLVRAVDIGRRLGRLRLALEATGWTRGRPASALLVLDRRGRLIHVGEHAKGLLDARDGLYVEAGCLHASDPKSASALEAMLGSGLRPSPRRQPGGVLHVARRRSPRPLRLELCPVHRHRPALEFPWSGLESPAAVIVLTDPDLDSRRLKDRLQARHGLTPAEADVAMEIARGKGRQAAATRLGISLGTVRTHLLRVFDKTGVHRQAELVKLLQDEAGRAMG